MGTPYREPDGPTAEDANRKVSRHIDELIARSAADRQRAERSRARRRIAFWCLLPVGAGATVVAFAIGGPATGGWFLLGDALAAITAFVVGPGTATKPRDGDSTGGLPPGSFGA